MAHRVRILDLLKNHSDGPRAALARMAYALYFMERDVGEGREEELPTELELWAIDSIDGIAATLPAELAARFESPRRASEVTGFSTYRDVLIDLGVVAWRASQNGRSHAEADEYLADRLPRIAEHAVRSTASVAAKVGRKVSR